MVKILLNNKLVNRVVFNFIIELFEVDCFLESAPGRKQAMKMQGSKAQNEESGPQEDEGDDEDEDIDGISLTTQDQDLLSKLDLKDGQTYVELKYPNQEGYILNVTEQSLQTKQRAEELSTQIDAQLALLGNLDDFI